MINGFLKLETSTRTGVGNPFLGEFVTIVRPTRLGKVLGKMERAYIDSLPDPLDECHWEVRSLPVSEAMTLLKKE